MATNSAIQMFGTSDFDRLDEMGDEYVHNICDVDESLNKFVAFMNALIKRGRIHLMDKETGIAHPASGVVGYSTKGLLVFNER